MKWTKEEDDYLTLHKDELDVVSEVLRRSQDSCKSRLYRLNHSSKKKQEVNETLQLEHKWFTSRSASEKLVKIKDLPKGAVSASTLKPWNGKKAGGNAFRNTKTGYRPDIELNVRSGWEANVCRVLKSYQIPIEYEPVVFNFPIKRGNKAYRPDIYLPNTDEYIEVKGYFDKNSMIKMKRFRKYYPEEWSRLTMIISKSSKASRGFCVQYEVPNVLFYQDIEKLYSGKVNNWEGKK